ncbi:hypothetical protein IHE33_00040 [Mycetohabitans endofungorum]|uniref:hypothetical protein n=1 Tax=Mycetohabitans endofungorum TaxID=417203 RepID=UPI0030CB864A
MMTLAQLLDDPAVLTRFEIDGERVQPNSIPFNYDTINGNKPHTYQNTVFLWQTDCWDIPSSDVDLKGKHPIDIDSPSGFQDLTPTEGLSKRNYLIAYAVGKEKNAVVTTLRLEPLGDGKYEVITPPEAEELSFKVTGVNPTTVSYSFRMPRGTSAEDDGDWIGVWKGSMVSNLYNDTQEPIYFLPILIDDSNGTGELTLPHARQFEIDDDYMLGYFKSGYDTQKPLRTTLAAVVSFKGPPKPILTQFGVDLINIDSTKIDFHYETLDGNRPNTYKNTVYLWQKEGWTVPSTDAGSQKHSITSDSVKGFQEFSIELEQANYLIAYAVGPTVNAVVTTQRLEYQEDSKSYKIIPAPSDEALSLKVTSIDTARVSYSFRMPAGTRAKANGDWVGVWKGTTVSKLYDGEEPLGLKSISIDDSHGTDRLNLSDGQQFVSGDSYMLGYFKSGYDQNQPNEPVRTTLAAIVHFRGP